jgi:hypothetical protein
MTEKRSLPLDDRSALDTARGADREQREETLRGFAGIRFSSVKRGSGCSSPHLLNRFDRSVFLRKRIADLGRNLVCQL